MDNYYRRTDNMTTEELRAYVTQRKREAALRQEREAQAVADEQETIRNQQLSPQAAAERRDMAKLLWDKRPRQ
jgi:hypothetical protein